MKNLHEIAEVENLEYFETTSERNGYPANIKGALKGFENFKQAEQIAEKYNLKIQIFTKKDGWQLWHRTESNVNEPLKNNCENYGDDYSQIFFDQYKSEEDFFDEEIKPRLENFNNLEDLKQFLDDQEEVWQEIEKLEENQIIITYLGKYYETLNEFTTELYHDTKHTVIGLI